MLHVLRVVAMLRLWLYWRWPLCRCWLTEECTMQYANAWIICTILGFVALTYLLVYVL